ncbi:C40 family peptidase [Hymenobacter sp. BRD128]|uniref:C40 family peptidase n=1 Tax=Hymenobacter sp. BRD128 TaxID=2675878 RepID=UPI001564705B|nr:C40 family peptidase [Hymenobacter sp. BRD128]QKG55518.1 C40 family peptidase [Hymenobacter sp. BRD128]
MLKSTLAPGVSREAAAPIVLVAGRSASPARPGPARRDSIVRLALRQLGTPYVWAGTSPATGFDCSGFITYVFGHFGVATPHATALLIEAGRPVPRAQAQPGDIVVFTGTAEGSTTAGHAGIVISALGETPLRFVHASSARRESGVKISQLENSGYERRFMQVRRVLDGGGKASATTFAAGRPATSASALAHPAGAVAALPPMAPEAALAPAVSLPARVVPLPTRPRLHPQTTAKATLAARRHVATETTTTKKSVSITRKALPKKPAPLARQKSTSTKKTMPGRPRRASARHRARPGI